MATVWTRGPYQFCVRVRRNGVSETKTFETRREAETGSNHRREGDWRGAGRSQKGSRHEPGAGARLVRKNHPSEDTAGPNAYSASSSLTAKPRCTPGRANRVSYQRLTFGKSLSEI